MPSTRARRELRSLMMSPVAASGTVIRSDWIGSSRIGRALAVASLSACDAASLNAISDESTSWCLPSNSTTRRSVSWYWPIPPAGSASATPFSTAGM